MKISPLSLVVTTAVLSCFGFVVRWVQNMSIYEENSGLPIRGAASSYILVLLSLAVIGIICFIAFRLSGFALKHEEASCIRSSDPLFRIFGSAAALLVFAAGVLLVLNIEKEIFPQLRTILGALALFSGLSLLYSANVGKERAGNAIDSFFAIVPILFACYWLIVSYKDHSSNPYLWQFGIEIIAIALSTQTLYLIAGFCFGKARPGQTIALCAISAFFCLMCLGDSRPLAYQLALAGLALFFLATLFSLSGSFDPETRLHRHLKGDF